MTSAVLYILVEKSVVHVLNICSVHVECGLSSVLHT